MRNVLFLSLMITFLFVHEVHASSESLLHEQNSSQKIASLQQKQWIHGAENCKANEDEAIEVYKYDESSYILRQNKCLSYEAPFIYVLIGDEKILVVDTGATESPKKFPLYQTIKSLSLEHLSESKTDEHEIVVIHSHSHSDHYGGDSQFLNQPNTTVVSANSDGVRGFFNFNAWPTEQTILDLGGRNITVIPTPGHQEEAISLYDHQTQWLITGDTLYPGVIYIKDWSEYKNSIARLAAFAESNTVSAILGAHIEMKTEPGEYYDIGSTYQPEESPLPLLASDLLSLNTKLILAKKPTKIVLDGMIVEPLGALPKLISNIARWFIQ